MNSNTFVCQLSEAVQDRIKVLVNDYFTKDGYSHNEITEIISSVMENRLWNIEEVIDIKQFL